jgi:hypothetical protein
MKKLALLLFVLPLLLLSKRAAAQHELPTMGGKGTLSIDQVSGFRVSSVGGLTYEGPLGFSIQRYSNTPFPPGGPDTVYHYTNFWLAPSADIFVIDHLSIGGLIEFVSTSSSVDIPQPNGAVLSTPLPGTTSFTLLPRIGYLIPLGERFGIWPRGGIGFGSRQTNAGNPNNPTRQTFSGALLDFDVGFVIRVNETFFIRAAPEITFSLGASHSDVDNRGITESANAGFFQFAGVAGIGVFLDL